MLKSSHIGTLQCTNWWMGKIIRINDKSVSIYVLWTLLYSVYTPIQQCRKSNSRLFCKIGQLMIPGVFTFNITKEKKISRKKII